MSRVLPGSRLRNMLAAGTVFAPGACDPFTARLIDRSGFGQALYLGGNALGLSVAKGQPIVTLTETVGHVAAICLASERPLIVDAGAGFGSPVHVHRTVLELEHAGAAAIHIDDQPYPKSPSYHRGEGGIVDVDTMARRLKVACTARRDPDTMIIARTDALREGVGIDAAIERGRAYREAGADALMVLDLAPADFATVREALPGLPLVWIGGVVPPVPGADELGEAGVDLALYPFNTIAAIADAVTALWTEAARSGRIAQADELLVPMRRELSEIAGLGTYWDLEDDLAGRPRRGAERKQR